MKTNLLIFLILLCIGAKNYAQNVNIPDTTFKSALLGNVAINTNGDSEIQVSEASAFIGTINVNNKSIADLTGIEAFTQLTTLFCGDNNLTELDISNNINLIGLDCSYNNLTQLDMSNNVNLIYLKCSVNFLNQLDISNNINLTYLKCQNNPNLYCIQVWDTTYADTAWTVVNDYIDPQMYFSLNCSNVSTAENLASSLSILPNPASDYLYISYKGEKKLSFTISDIWGKTLAAWEAHSAGAFYQKEMPIADFPVGIYFLSVQAGDKKVVKKFVKE